MSGDVFFGLRTGLVDFADGFSAGLTGLVGSAFLFCFFTTARYHTYA